MYDGRTVFDELFAVKRRILLQEVRQPGFVLQGNKKQRRLSQEIGVRG